MSSSDTSIKVTLSVYITEITSQLSIEAEEVYLDCSLKLPRKPKLKLTRPSTRYNQAKLKELSCSASIHLGSIPTASIQHLGVQLHPPKLNAMLSTRPAVGSKVEWLEKRGNRPGEEWIGTVVEINLNVATVERRGKNHHLLLDELYTLNQISNLPDSAPAPTDNPLHIAQVGRRVFLTRTKERIKNPVAPIPPPLADAKPPNPELPSAIPSPPPEPEQLGLF